MTNIQLKDISQNTSRKCHELILGDTTLYFSFATVVGFYHPSTGIVLCENIWGKTTGKHLNWIGDASLRVPRAEFLEKLSSLPIAKYIG